MQAAQRAGHGRQRMIVLNELGGDAGRFQIAAAPGFGKEASRIAMNLRNEKFDLRDIQGRYFHDAILARDSAHRRQFGIGPRRKQAGCPRQPSISPGVAIVRPGICCAALCTRAGTASLRHGSAARSIAEH